MKKPVTMPSLTDTMESGRLVRWMKQPGDEVKRGDAIAEIETDKAVTELETFQGYLAGPLADEDTEVAVNKTIGWITDQPEADSEEKAGKDPAEKQAESTDDNDAANNDAAQEQSIGPEEAQGKKAEASEKEDQEDQGDPEDQKDQEDREEQAEQAEQAEQKEKKEEGEITSETETKNVVLEAAFANQKQKQESPGTAMDATGDLEAGPPFQIEPQANLRRIIAEGMIAAAMTPQFRVSSRFSLQKLVSSAKKREISFTVLLARACALTVAEYPDFNSAWTPDGLARRSRVDVGIAMETEDGLTSPVLRDAAQRTIDELAEDWRDLKDRVKNHRARPEEYRGATFYLSNLGTVSDVFSFDAIVPLGAAAILAVAADTEQGTLLTISCDHRLLAGADAAKFLQSLGQRLCDPAGWME